MKLNCFIFLLILCSFFPFFKLSAQNVPDSTVDFDAPLDTAKFYKKLFDYSKDRKFLYMLYRSVFNPPVRTVATKKKKSKIVAVPVNRYKGKVIRKISVVNLEPFGSSIDDTSHKPHSVVQKGGNFLHIKTHNWVIKNYLLLKENDVIDPLKLEESERLLRSSGFLREAKITVVPVPGTRDSFDLHVLSQDYWSIRPDITLTSSRVRYRLIETNFGGFGHVFDNRVTDMLNESSPLILDGSYTVPTIGNTFISPSIYYGTSPENNIRGLRIERPFITPLSRVAGGLDLLSRSHSDSIRFSDDTLYYYNFKSFVSDIWLGYSWKLMHGETDEERSTRLVTALRYSRLRYPTLTPDNELVQNHFSNSDFYLASISISSRKYIKEKYIFKFGEIEDVPVGNKITFTTGLENRNDGQRSYYGVFGATGRYVKKVGYLYGGIGYSTFVKKNDLFKGEASAEFIYFTPLSKIGTWWTRQFVNFNFVYGINRDADEYIRLNGDIGIPGYKYEFPYGTSRMILTYQAVLYTPYEFLGFRFAPILIAGIGIVGDYNASALKGRVYQAYGLGILIKNELLVLNTFQVTAAFYPVIPSGGSAIRFNPVKLNESRFRDFDITRPSVSTFE